MFKIVKLFNLFKRVIIFFVMLSYFCRRKSGVAVPINILFCPLCVDMFTVFNIKSAVIMLGIVNAVFPALPLCLVSFIQSSFPPSSNFLFDGNCMFPARRGQVSSAHFLPKRSLGERQLCCQSCRFQRQAIPSTSRRKHQLYWAMAAALDLHREAALPVPLPGGLAALCTPATG